MSVGSDVLGRGAPASACLLLSESRQLWSRCPSGWIIACGSGALQHHPPCDKCFWFAFTRTKCCHCYVKYLLRAFCRCAVRSHSAVPLNLHAYPRWPICAQKETQILYLMPPRKCANLPRGNSTCSSGCVPTLL